MSREFTRVVFITNLDVLGGTENNLISIVAHPDFYKSVESYLFSGTRPHQVIEDGLKYTSVRIFQHNRFLGLRLPKIFRATNFKRLIREVNPDLVVFWNHVAKSRQLEICKHQGIKTIFFERGTGWSSHDSEAMNRFLHGVDKVLANTYAGKRRLMELWGYQGECHVLHNALRPEIAKVEATPKSLPVNRPVRIGVAARLVAYKGVASVVLAMHELQKEGLEAELHVAGDGVEGDKLRTLARDLNVQAVFHGVRQDMTSFYKYIDILVVPSIREPIGTVAIEAQALGCPVLATAVDGLPEVIQHNLTGWVVKPSWDIRKYLGYTAQKKDIPSLVFYPHLDRLGQPLALDPRDIANLVLEVVKNKYFYSKMSENAINFVQENFKFNEYIDRIIGLISCTPTATAHTPSVIKDDSA